jgi:hypothetical protein
MQMCVYLKRAESSFTFVVAFLSHFFKKLLLPVITVSIYVDVYIWLFYDAVVTTEVK